MTLIFFTDRDLGNQFPEILRKAGIHVEQHSDHFRHDTEDEYWLNEVGRKAFFCLTHDKRIRYKQNEIDAVMRASVGLFILIGNATHSELAHNFVNTSHKVQQFIKKHRRPFIAKIYRPTKKLRSPPRSRSGDVKLWLSQKEWAGRVRG